MITGLLLTLQQAAAVYTGFEGYAAGTNVAITYYGENVANKAFTYDALQPENYPEWQGLQSGVDLSIFSGIAHGNISIDQLPEEYRVDQDITFNGTIEDEVISRNYYNSIRNVHMFPDFRFSTPENLI